MLRTNALADRRTRPTDRALASEFGREPDTNEDKTIPLERSDRKVLQQTTQEGPPQGSVELRNNERVAA